MKIKKGLVIREIDNEFILIDTGVVPPIFNGIIKLNSTGKSIIDLLSNKECSYNELISKLLDIYDVDKEVLTKSVNPFLDELRRVKLLDGE